MRLPTPKFFAPALFSLCTASAVVCGLAGCGSNVATTSTPPTSPTPPTGSYAGTGFTGAAMAAKQPLVGATVQLYAAGTTGNGSSGTALLGSALTTDATGSFTVPPGYLCPSAVSQLYVVARGGSPGSASAAANSAIALITVLGACDQVAGQIVVNEATSVAATYALSQFLSAGANIGASSTNTVGLQNAAATASALVSVTSGNSPGSSFAANGSSPAPKIDSLANLLNACVVSTLNGSACGTLFADTTPTGGASAPTNTLDALLDLVRNPAHNVTSLYTLSTGSTAFLPALSATPSDWTLFINYTSGAMNGPTGLGVDSQGNVWVASYFNVASLFSPLGKPLLPQGVTGFGLSASYGLAVDGNNDAWIPNEPNPGFSGNSVSVFNSGGQSVAGGGGFTQGGLDYPIAVAIDTDNSAWVVDYGNSSLSHLSNSGQSLSGTTGYTSPLFAFPVAAAIDTAHNVWVANQSAMTVTKVAPDGSQFTNYSCCDGPSGLAIDQLGNVWVANYSGNSISEISSSGAILSNGGSTGGGIDHPQGVAIDGAGRVWIANYRGPSITELAGAGAAAPGTLLTPSGGLGADAALLEAYAIAVDASGNLWISDFGSNTLTEFIGLASPVRTPLIGPPVTP